MKVVCLNADNYLSRGGEYVEKLANMVARNLTIPHEFICLTERDLPKASGWWKKLDLLQMSWGDWVLYLDLDVVITSRINHLVKAATADPARLWMRDDFSYSIVHPRFDLDDAMRRTLGGVGCCNSSVMIWHDRIELTPDELEIDGAHGDQNVLTRALWPSRIGLLPNESINSYKYHVQRGVPPAPIVVMHGAPKNHEVHEQWLAEHWR
jgi:hypothetical protein